MAEPNFNKLFNICVGDIVANARFYHADAVVNAANPTLMGSRVGVDGSIHKAINKSLQGILFKDKIREELDTDLKVKGRDSVIRCKRGKAVTTRGYDLCSYVIHAVGPEFDGGTGYKVTGTSSCAITLESCYTEIVNEIKKHPDIRCIIIPVIGGGTYMFPYDLAVKIAVAATGNALLKWKIKNPEEYEAADLREVYFCVYKNEDRTYIDDAFKEYMPLFFINRKVVFQTSADAHNRYKYEVSRNDEARGYFDIAKWFRYWLVRIRTLFLPLLWLKDVFAGCDWQKRRTVVELIAWGKLIFPLFIYVIVRSLNLKGVWLIALQIPVIYFMADTITYLLVLIVLADIQKPSANILRSMLLLLINFLEVSMDFSIIYYLQNYGSVRFRDAVSYGVLGEEACLTAESVVSIAFRYLNAGVKFFFMTLAFSYFLNHMRQREFIS